MTNFCPNKERCGSCSWSRIPYDKQLQQKLSDINGSFKLKELDFVCEHILASKQTEHYRNRMDFVIDFEGRVGMREKGKWWKVIDGHTCFLSQKEIETAFHAIREWSKTSGLSYYDRKSHEGFLRYAVIRSNLAGKVLVNIVTSESAGPEEEKKLRLLGEIDAITTLVWSVNETITDVSFGQRTTVLSGSGYLDEKINNFTYRISPQAFFQTNSFTSPLLQQTVLDAVGDVKDKTVLDLYCGTGFFTVALDAKRVIGIEEIEVAIDDARVNAELNNSQAEFHSTKAENFDWSSFAPDVVLVDPPRSGMHDKALKQLMDLSPERIIYVSCSPKNFAREMVQLQQSYLVEDMIAIDMFPHTPHVELVSTLVRKPL